jgi:EAL domain-containing protein (putative c-di-GMP-specific phosphodiesterase class I)
MDMGHALNLSIVAEGIEREEQLAQLKTLHCTCGQGYLFARPLDVTSAELLLDEQSQKFTEAAPEEGTRVAA